MKAPGDRIGRFRVERLLGQGGAAEVYLVHHELLETAFALKLLPVARRGMAKRLIQEGRIQAQLRHPNVVSVTDVIEEKGQIGLVMEFIEGPSLEELIRSDGAMELPEAMELFVQVLSGVAAAHQAGVLHRDLKPANVLLTAEGDRVVAKVADFGIARMAEAEDLDAAPGRARKPVGTPGYMAPEAVRDPDDTDARSDVFALGAILYEMLSGRRAFGASASAKDVLDAVSRGRFTPLRQLSPNTPAEIEAAIHRALSVLPEERFPSCLALAEALGVSEELVPSRALPPLDERTPPELSSRREEPPPRESPAFDTVNEFLEDREEELPAKGPDAIITWAPEEEGDEFGLPNAENLPVARAKPLRQRSAQDWAPPPVPKRSPAPANPMEEPALAPEPPLRAEPRPEPPQRAEPVARLPRPAPLPAPRAQEHPRAQEPARAPEPKPVKPKPPKVEKEEEEPPSEPSVWVRSAPMVVLPLLLIALLIGGGVVLGSSAMGEAREAALKQQSNLEAAFTAEPALVADALRLATADGTKPSAVPAEYFERRLAASQSAPDLAARREASAELQQFLLLQVPSLYQGDDPVLLALRHDLETRVRTLGEAHEAYNAALEAWHEEAAKPTGSLAVLTGVSEAPH